MVKLGTERWYLWAAVDVETWEILAVALTQGQSGAVSNRLWTGAAFGVVDVAETPAVEVDAGPGPYIDQPALLKAEGEWRTTFAGIEIDVHTEERTEALRQLFS